MLFLIIFGFLFIYRLNQRIKLKQINNDSYPNIDEDIFIQWKNKQLRSYDVLIWSIIMIIIGSLGLYVFIFFGILFLIVAGFMGSHANNFGKKYGIKYPPKSIQINDEQK